MESSTNSPIGSHHWYVTLLSFVKHVGEYLRDYGSPKPEDTLNNWGRDLVSNAEELIYGFNAVEGFKSMCGYETVNQCEDAKQLKAAVLLLADANGMIQGRKRSFKAARMAGFVEGIRQQALYIKYYEDNAKENKS